MDIEYGAKIEDRVRVYFDDPNDANGGTLEGTVRRMPAHSSDSWTIVDDLCQIYHVQQFVMIKVLGRRESAGTASPEDGR